MTWSSHLRKGTIVPEVALVGKAVSDEAEFALLDVLLDGVEELLLGDLVGGVGLASAGEVRGVQST